MTVAVAIGSLPAWLAVAALVVGGYFFVKGGGGPALSVLETANRVLTTRINDLEKVLADRERRISDLEARTNLEPLLATIAGEFANHERRAQERHQAQSELTAELVRATAAQTDALAKAVNGQA